MSNSKLTIYIVVAAGTIFFSLFEYWLNRNQGHTHKSSVVSSLLLLSILSITSVVSEISSSISLA